MRNLDQCIALAEAGDSSLWEEIARHLLADRARKAKPRKAKSGQQTWALTVFADGREYLTSQYRRASDDATLAAHADYAALRYGMEHLEGAPMGEQIERIRGYCFEARLRRQGNWHAYTFAAAQAEAA